MLINVCLLVLRGKLKNKKFIFYLFIFNEDKFEEYIVKFILCLPAQKKFE